jgi:hypothetical protein
VVGPKGIVKITDNVTINLSDVAYINKIKEIVHIKDI